VTGPANYKRRSNLTTEEVDQMKAEEAAGKPRNQIAADHHCTPACVTRRLGAVRAYKRRDKTETAPQVLVTTACD
jgi:hypothetical protein